MYNDVKYLFEVSGVEVFPSAPGVSLIPLQRCSEFKLIRVWTDEAGNSSKNKT